MKKVTLIILVLCFLGAGFYVGSQDNTYAYKFFGGSAGRFPANDSARDVQDIWERGKLTLFDEESIAGVSYSSLSNVDQNICDVYPEIQALSIHAFAEASVSDSVVKMSVLIDCDGSGPSPIFIKSFCSERLDYFRSEHAIFNSTFTFENILDGFPRSWYIDSADVSMRDGLSMVGVKPSLADVKAFGKYTLNCSAL